jgi:hypothetical protein
MLERAVLERRMKQFVSRVGAEQAEDGAAG